LSFVEEQCRNKIWRSEMKRTLITLAIGLALTFNAASFAQAMTNGVVRKVDASANKITIKHGPMKSLGMDEPMTMVYRVKDPAMLKSVKAGDKIKFELKHDNGGYTVTKIQK